MASYGDQPFLGKPLQLMNPVNLTSAPSMILSRGLDRVNRSTPSSNKSNEFVAACGSIVSLILDRSCHRLSV